MTATPLTQALQVTTSGDASVARDGAALLGALEQSQFTARHLLFYVTIVLCHFFDGFDIQMMGYMLPGVAAEFHLSPTQAGFLASSVFIGMFVGGIVVGALADRFGRKYTLMFAVGTYGLTSLMAVFATDIQTLTLVRMLQGFGLGAEVPLVFTYLAEFLPARHRGLLMASIVAFWQAAGFVAALSAIYIVPNYGWRGLFMFSAIPAAIVFVLVTRLPESVRFLVARGRMDQARRVVERFSRLPANVMPLITPAATSTPPKANWRDLFRSGYLRITLAIWVMQFCGGSVFIGVLVWLPSIFVRMGFPIVHGFAFTAVIAGAGAIGNVLGGYLIDRIGRRTTIGGAFFLGSALMLLWGFADSPAMIVGLGASAALFGFAGAGGPLFVYTSEVYPTQFRATGTALAASWQRIGGIVAPSALGLIFASTLPNFTSFALMSAVLLIGGLTVVFFTFETRGRSLEEINAALLK
jgi:putative MFS transporter